MEADKQGQTWTINRPGPTAICRYGNFLIPAFLAFYLFIIPFAILLTWLDDPGLKGAADVPRFTYGLHRRLSPRFEKWARQRIGSGKAEQLSVDQIAATEWPAFGSVFYLWATESLQQAWEKDKYLSAIAPKIYAAGAIDAAAALVTDPGNASWVKKQWGDEYLHKENVFYRMLLISAMTSYQKMLGGDKYLEPLRDQVETLSAEIDKSRYGLLDDYPGQCYPTDIVAAIAAIRRADGILGTDHSVFVARAIRGFEGKFVDETGLPPYHVDLRTGSIDISRGCSNQWMTAWAPEIWPDRAKLWYDNFHQHFWQSKYGAVGFREFPRDYQQSDWHIDVDAGPVIGGFGAAACGFGVGASRANNRFDHAYPLGAEVLVMSWPLPDGTLFSARMLSNAAHAKYLGEAALLYSFTRTAAGSAVISRGGTLPDFVYYGFGAYLACGVLVLLADLWLLRWWRGRVILRRAPVGWLQVVVWAAMVIAGFAIGFIDNPAWAIVLLLAAQLLPIGEKSWPKKTKDYIPDSLGV
jgi:hypothetical protein